MNPYRTPPPPYKATKWQRVKCYLGLHFGDVYQVEISNHPLSPGVIWRHRCVCGLEMDPALGFDDTPLPKGVRVVYED